MQKLTRFLETLDETVRDDGMNGDDAGAACSSAEAHPMASVRTMIHVPSLAEG